MGFIRDRRVFRYCVFLICCAAMMLLLGATLWLWQGEAAKGLLLSHDRAVASALLSQGVSEDAVARAMAGADSFAQVQSGEALLAKIGISENTPAWLFLPVARLQRRSAALMLISVALVVAAMLTGAFFFMRSMERLYAQASGTLLRFIEGDFSRRLPQLGEGSVCRFFASVDQLATILQSKNDAQEKTKAFLKGTISDISHQIKTPLAALCMYNEILLDEPERADVVAHYAKRTGQALSRMQALIEAMLRITRLDAGSVQFERETVLVGDLVAHSIRELTGRAQEEGKRILTQGPEDATLACDPMWTSEAIGNVVKNALDHTKRGGNVRISWARTPAMLHISVSDDGSGIAPEDIHHIFKRFYRSRRGADSQGVRLGLPLARSIVEGQGGRLGVKSEAGRGSEFTFSFLTES